MVFIMELFNLVSVRIAAVLIFLVVLCQLFGLVRYHLRLVTLYDGRVDVVMTESDNLSLLRNHKSFGRAVNEQTPNDIDFEEVPLSVAREVQRIE